MKLTKIDLSYKSQLRYIIDIHLALILMICVTYFIECIENKAVALIIMTWAIGINGWMLFRVLNFYVDKKEKITDSMETDK